MSQRRHGYPAPWAPGRRIGATGEIHGGSCRRRRPWILLLLLFTGVPLTAWGGEGAESRFQAQYQELLEVARRSPLGIPLNIQSEERDGQVTAEVNGIITQPFEAFRAAVGSPASLCEFLPLNLNVKACTYQTRPRETLLTLYLGRKHYQSPHEASSQSYQLTIQAQEPGSLSVALNAVQGLFGTTEHRFQLEAAGVNGRTVIALRSSYVQGAASRLATAIYLATAGRDKVGFSRENAVPGAPPTYVKGVRGMVERNVMRYYLALQAFLDTHSLPEARRLAACINEAYDLMERYPLQLHDLEKAEYLDAKRRERENQLRLQQALSAAGSRPGDP